MGQWLSHYALYIRHIWVKNSVLITSINKYEDKKVYSFSSICFYFTKKKVFASNLEMLTVIVKPSFIIGRAIRFESHQLREIFNSRFLSWSKNIINFSPELFELKKKVFASREIAPNS